MASWLRWWVSERREDRDVEPCRWYDKEDQAWWAHGTSGESWAGRKRWRGSRKGLNRRIAHDKVVCEGMEEHELDEMGHKETRRYGWPLRTTNIRDHEGQKEHEKARRNDEHEGNVNGVAEDINKGEKKVLTDRGAEEERVRIDENAQRKLRPCEDL